MMAPVQAFDRVPPPGSPGMLNDIWETPGVLKAMLDKHLKESSSGSLVVELPSLCKPLAKAASADSETGVVPAKRLADRSPLDVMAACSQGRNGATFDGKITIVGVGTSWHAALLGEYLIEHLARIPVDVQYASEFRHRQLLVRPGDVVIVVSNSGESYDAVESLRLVQRSASAGEVMTLAIVNEEQSTLAREADAFIAACAGKEEGVASTKAFSCTIVAFVLLAVALGEKRDTIEQAEKQILLQKLKELPSQVQQVLEHESLPLRQREGKGKTLHVGDCALFDIGSQNVLAQNFIFLGRGFNFPIALEGAMKLKEIAYIHAEGYPAAEMKHGPIALIDTFMPVVVIAPKSDPSYDKIKSNIEEVKARSGAVIAITEDSNAAELAKICECVISVPPSHDYLMPLIFVIPLQLLSYMMGVLRGNQVDQPRGLQKSHTEDNLGERN